MTSPTVGVEGAAAILRCGEERVLELARVWMTDDFVHDTVEELRQ